MLQRNFPDSYTYKERTRYEKRQIKLLVNHQKIQQLLHLKNNRICVTVLENQVILIVLENHEIMIENRKQDHRELKN